MIFGFIEEKLNKLYVMKSTILTLAITLIGFSYVFAQTPGWNWPEDRQTAEEKNVIYTDMMKLGNYKQAVPALSWLLINAPDLNESIYINGAKIYENLVDTEKNESKMKEYQDSAILMYDLRIKYFNDEAAVLNRKAFTAYKFYKDDNEKYKELFELYQRTFDLNKNQVWDQNLLSYMDIVRRYKLTGGDLSDEQVLEIYDQIIEIIEFKINENKNVDRLEVINDNVDKLLAATVKVDCDFIQNTLGPKLKADPNDLKLAKNIFKLSMAGKCLDAPIFLDAVKVMFEQEPNFGLAKLIGDRSYIGGEYQLALQFYGEAVKLTEDNIKIAEIYLKEADICSRQDRKVRARDFAKMALTADPSLREAWTLIGNLYYTSYNDCKQGENIVEDRAVYFAAYEMYRNAGNQDAMRSSKAQFPTMEEIFTYNMEVGQPIKVGCWINEVVTVQRRD
jgi:tetratricopeptide (TPR) repeat protein